MTFTVSFLLRRHRWVFALLVLIACLTVTEAFAETESFEVGEKIKKGTSWVGPKLEEGRIRRIKVLVRRINPNKTDTQISVGLHPDRQLGVQQVDSEELHWLSFDVDGAETDRRKIVITAHNGSVFVDEVVVKARR